MKEIPKFTGPEASATSGVPGVSIEMPVPGQRRMRQAPLLTKQASWDAFKQSVVMLRPDIQWKNPVMF
ncbi:MAG TPA: hypothetical protein VG457_04945, partial [Planctomycetota bacterium]|nr:hypothetical protein [Planctomycetota bacterium]